MGQKDIWLASKRAEIVNQAGGDLAGMESGIVAGANCVSAFAKSP